MRTMMTILMLMLVLRAVGVAPPESQPGGADEKKQAPDLQLKVVAVLAGESEDGAFHLDVVLHNRGPKTLNLYMGWAAGNNGVVWPLALTLKARDKQGHEHSIPVGFDGIIVIGGRLDPYVITLPAGASFSQRTTVAPKQIYVRMKPLT